jgi:hypothetical protein
LSFHSSISTIETKLLEALTEKAGLSLFGVMALLVGLHGS